MACSETLTTQSLFDGALEGEAARSAERHVETCAECKELLTELETTRRAIRAASLYRKADERLRARIAASLDAESHATSRSATRRVFSWPQPFWIGALSGGLATAAAAALAFLLLLPLETDALVADVTTAHIRSLVGSHLVDVSTADPGAASTWLRSHAGLTFRTGAPTGYQLIGVRADYLYGSNAAVAVYRRGRRVVNLFAWPEHEDEKLPVSATANGYNIVFWKHGDVVFCAVSNLPVEALQKFAQTV
jgi:anti-sigma factor RsiW